MARPNRLESDDRRRIFELNVLAGMPLRDAAKTAGVDEARALDILDEQQFLAVAALVRVHGGVASTVVTMDSGPRGRFVFGDDDEAAA